MTAPLKPLGLGLALHSSPDYLRLIEPLLSQCNFLEVAPEATWFPSPNGDLVFSEVADEVERLQKKSGVPLVAHGLGLSPGTVSDHPRDREARDRWLRMIATSQTRFDFQWYLEHQGWMRHGGTQAVLPLPLPRHAAVTAAVQRCMDQLRSLSPFVGFQNSAWTFSLFPPSDAPAWYTAMAMDTGSWLMLDLHSAWCHCHNYRLDWKTYLDGLPAERVLAARLGGGSHSEAGWIPSGKVFLMDTQEGPIPAEVWDMAAYILPRCPNLRGIVLARADAPFKAADLKADLKRARTLWKSLSPVAEVAPLPSTPPTPRVDTRPVHALEQHVIRCLYAPNSWEALCGARIDPAYREPIDPDGFRLTSALVQKLRFKRLQQGDKACRDAYATDPGGFGPQFDQYAAAVPATFYFAAAEARAWEAFWAKAAEASKRPVTT